MSIRVLISRVSPGYMRTIIWMPTNVPQGPLHLCLAPLIFEILPYFPHVLLHIGVTTIVIDSDNGPFRLSPPEDPTILPVNGGTCSCLFRNMFKEQFGEFGVGKRPVFLGDFRLFATKIIHSNFINDRWFD